MEDEDDCMDINYILYFILGYLIGSIPFALIVGKGLFKVDIRKHGSGNLGGSNAGRVLGSKAGALVIVLDVLKAVIPTLVVLALGKENYAIILGLAIAIGHCYPIFAGFKGGKAVATSFGYIGACVITNPYLFLFILLIPLITLVLVIKITKYVSIGSITSLAVAVIMSYLLQSNLVLSLSFTLLWLFVIFRHTPNIKNLINHTEKKVSW